MLLNADKAFTYYRQDLKIKALQLRKASTQAERMLWKKIRGRQILGQKFIRQRPILSYIVDFLCPALQIIIEIDGFSHNFKLDYHEKRQKEIEVLCYTFFRVTEQEVRKDIQNVLERLYHLVEDRQKSYTPLPPSRGVLTKVSSRGAL